MSEQEDYGYLQQMDYLQKPAFDAASMDYKNRLRTAYLADADTLAFNELLLIQSRARHLSRNNSIVSAAEDKFVAKLKSVKLLWKDANGQKHEVMQDLWDEFFENPMLDGFGDGNTMQSVWNRDRMQSGEAISRIVTVANSDTRIPLRMQNIESEYLDINYNGSQDGHYDPENNIRYGITFDSNNMPTMYHFMAERYYSSKRPLGTNNIKRVHIDARDICHMFERKRSNQWRGIPVVASILQDVYSITDLKDATLAKQIAASAISWIIERPNAGMPLNSPGSVLPQNKANADLNAKNKLFFLATGGQVQYTNPGEKFNLVQSSDIGNNLISLLQNNLQAIASAYNMPYYMLTGDTSGLNFSSIRAVLLEFKDYLDYVHHFINLPNGLAKIAKRFKQTAMTLGYDVSDAKYVYQFPKDHGIDALKDNQANILAMQSGGTTLDRILEENYISKEEWEKDIEYRRSLQLDGLVDVGKGGGTKNNSQAKSNSAE